MNGGNAYGASLPWSVCLLAVKHTNVVNILFVASLNRRPLPQEAIMYRGAIEENFNRRVLS